jgi:ribosomal protein S18 acetylase RimI-like enzyme
MIVRPTVPADIAALKRVLDVTGLFPSEMLADMVDSFLHAAECDEVWLTCEEARDAIGFCFAAPEKFTEGTWNMLAIAVHPDSQRKGAGAAIVKHLEGALRERGERILIADTAGTNEFAQTRQFYRRNGYTEEARIRDFWAVGNDKVVFWKAIGQLSDRAMTP